MTDDPFGPEFTYNPEIEYVGDLLAILHSDGGHHEAEHGRSRAAFDAIVKHYALLARAEAAEAEVERLREGAARYLAVQLDFDGLDVQEVHVFATPEERQAFLRQQAKDPELGRPARATKRGILWDYSGYRTALFPVDAPTFAGSLS